MDNLEVNQRTFAKNRLVLIPSCEGWLVGGQQAPGLKPAWTMHPLPQNTHRMQRQDFAEEGFLFLFPWKNKTNKKILKQQKKLFKKTLLPLLSSLEILLKKKKTTQKKNNKKKKTRKKKLPYGGARPGALAGFP